MPVIVVTGNSSALRTWLITSMTAYRHTTAPHSNAMDIQLLGLGVRDHRSQALKKLLNRNRVWGGYVLLVRGYGSL